MSCTVCCEVGKLLLRELRSGYELKFQKQAQDDRRPCSRTGSGEMGSIEPPVLTERRSYKKQLPPRDRVAGASQSPELRGTTPQIHIFERRRIAERRSTRTASAPSRGSGVIVR